MSTALAGVAPMQYPVLVERLRLDLEFLAGYWKKQPVWGFDGLGYIIYLRTYSRKKADGSNEDWWETVQRFTEGNYNAEWQRRKEIGEATLEALQDLTQEMKRFYEMSFNLLILPPGRGIWMSGTEYEQRSGDALNNCWGVACRPQAYEQGEELKVSFPFAFTMDQAMKGGGVGINIQRKNVELIPEVQNKVKLRIHSDASHPDLEECLPHGAGTYALTGEEAWTSEVPAVRQRKVYFRIPDSREGWVMALRVVIDAHFEGTKELYLDISGIRCRGSEIKGFGGTASGPGALVEMLVAINKIINSHKGEKMPSVRCGDILQNEGKCVIAGNIRRTALILIGDEEDRDFIESKNYALDKNKEASMWRWTSNNSIDVHPDTPRETMEEMANNIYYNGEPGYVNMFLARNYGRIIDGYQEAIDELVEIFNPCGEIGLANGENCNLFEINLPRIHQWIEAGLGDESLYQEVMTMAARYAYRVTFREYEWMATRDIIERNHRIGVGITGVSDWVLLKFGEPAILGFEEDGAPIFNPEVTEALDKMYGYVKWANLKHSKELKSTPSIKVTTVKPSGTTSILMGCNPGMHDHWAGYFIRRVRFAKQADLVPVLYACGYTIEPAVLGEKEDGTLVYDDNTVVISFPVKAPTADHPLFRTSGDVPLREQAAMQELLATYWADNAVSATLTFRKGQTPEEEAAVIAEITDVLDRAKRVIKSTTLLPYATGTYHQMPYEQISKDEFEEMAANVTMKPWEILGGNINFDAEDTSDSMECAGGSCPLK